jgi:hypothetical protein
MGINIIKILQFVLHFVLSFFYWERAIFIQNAFSYSLLNHIFDFRFIILVTVNLLILWKLFIIYPQYRVSLKSLFIFLNLWVRVFF